MQAWLRYHSPRAKGLCWSAVKDEQATDLQWCKLVTKPVFDYIWNELKKKKP